ncbi:MULTISPECIES: LysR family transcriptional regulator [Curvibacter]|jgi:DNA-binding transcriptional LysR family regulator|uniref:LysR family transcriptional regulator n=1 Tax=Curvibacter TaxID=281915 RepID=UPI0003691333|nr:MULTISPECIES: LysR family transcriptional regulator [Curvibacter]MBV5292151.1 LysR family transcriptional regulator [Curvibacter lanceolatus]
MDFHGIDLNLLVAFDALMGERNVTRAATRVGVSQPAMSAALSRLRKLLGDPLFLRGASGLLPTQRARDLAEPLSQALAQIGATLLAPTEFLPERASLVFNLGLQDYPTYVLLPPLLEALAEQAPGIALNVRAFNDRNHAVDLLDAGAIDAAVGVVPTQTDGRILTRPLLEDEFVTILARDNPAARRGMSMKNFLSLSHVLVSPEGDRHGIVDQALARDGKVRKLGLTLPQMFAVPGVVARTNMAATVMKRFALSSEAASHLLLFPPPLTLPAITFHLTWHRRNDASQSQVWLRNLIASTALRL